MHRIHNWKPVFWSIVCALFTSCAIGQDSLAEMKVDSTKAFTEVFQSPVAHEIIFAGSFGELRSSHFHGGIDIKSTTGEVGDTILASMSGYVSRVKVQTGGYGQVLYIDHPNGYTTVYAHLDRFQDSITEYITNKQFEAKSYEIDVYPEPGRFTFTQGEFIGILGNTGRSYGPHLHFEIRETATEIPQNPYLFGIGAKDDIHPLMPSIDIHGLDNQSLKIWSTTQKINQAKDGSINSTGATIEVPAWRAGVAVQTFDRMNGASNKNGIYQLEMSVDDTLYYAHTMDAVGYDVTRFIDAHVDYEEKIKNKRTLIKCYKTPGNQLSFYSVLKNNGEVKLYKSKKRKIKITVKDYHQNVSSYTFYLQRRDALASEIPERVFQKFLPVGKESKFKLGSCRFYFGENALEKNTYLNYEESMDTTLAFKLNEEYEPLFGYPVASIPLTGIDSSDYSKVVLLHKGTSSYGGVVDGDSLRVRIGSFGSYKVHLDTLPPSIEPKNFVSDASALPFFRFEIKDNYETKGYARDIKYDVFIDGEWTIASHKLLDNTLIIPLENLVTGEHTLQVRVEDHSGNVAIWKEGFTK